LSIVTSIRAFVAILVLAGASAALGREYHVSVHGDDASDGSKTTPLKTIRNLSSENADGSPVRIDTDYCGKRRKAGKPVWDRLFNPMPPAINLGFGADRVQQVLWRIDLGELDGLMPQRVVLMIGANCARSTRFNSTSKPRARCCRCPGARRASRRSAGVQSPPSASSPRRPCGRWLSRLAGAALALTASNAGSVFSPGPSL
jgi:hypothetical protein